LFKHDGKINNRRTADKRTIKSGLRTTQGRVTPSESSVSSKPIRSLVLSGLGLCLLLTSLIACNLTNRIAPQATSPGTLGTWAAQTLDVRRTGTATVREQFTATPPAPTLLPDRNLPVIIAQVNTNCRAGPNIIYPRLGWLLVGKQSTVYGRNEEQTWWYIANPTRPGEYCWVWGQTTTVSGIQAGVPIITPVALADVDFKAGFSGLHHCNGEKYIFFQVKNTGNTTFYLANITIQVVKNHKVVFTRIYSTPYLRGDDTCPPGRKSLKAGSSAFIAVEKVDTIPANTQLQATINLCTEAGPEQTCVGRKVGFQLQKSGGVVIPVPEP
jgi:hypothetical protein